MKRILGGLLLLVAACAKRPVSDEVTIDIAANGSIVLTAATRFSDDAQDVVTRRRVETARKAAMDGIDQWSARFDRVDPEEDQLTWERKRGALLEVSRSAEITFEDLQHFFSDAALTFQLTRQDGYSELTIYPGTSTRASREQRAHFDASMKEWSKDVARYLVAVDHLYDYLDAQPARAEPVFAALLDSNDINAGQAVTEEEAALLDALFHSMIAITDRVDQGDGWGLGEEADLLYNPFPAEMVIRLPRESVRMEGFEKKGEQEMRVPQIDLYDVIASMEGTWITPDPLAILLREERTSSTALANMRRRSTDVVFPTEIENSVIARLQRPSKYLVRWRD